METVKGSVVAMGNGGKRDEKVEHRGFGAVEIFCMIL